MKKDLTQGPVLKGILGLSLPIIGASFLQIANNVIDMFWVGKLGSDAVASVGTAGFYLQLFWALTSVFYMGVGINTSRLIGEKKEGEALRWGREGLFLLLIASIILFIFVQLFQVPLISFFGLNEEVQIGAISYLTWMSLSFFITPIIFLFTAISQARGDTKTPLYYTGFGLVINIILDPIFILLLDWGIEGAAWATIIAQVVSSLLFIVKRGEVFLGGKEHWELQLSHAKKIINTGFPASMQRILFTIVGIMIAKIIADWGSEAIAAQKIGIQIESITFMCIGGLSSGMMSFTGQNLGAKRPDRILDGYTNALKIGISIGIINGIFFIYGGPFLMSLFVTDAGTIEIGANYLFMMGIAQVFMCIEMLTSGIINGLGKTKIPASINIAFTIIRIPMALFFAYILELGINGVWLSIACSMFLRSIALSVAFQYLKKKFINKLTHEII
ncbi:MATE family efflux transporter [Flammeovirga pacifica]|uniref:Multidrug-efflux transporter n=1 Tax=Flammeovirga pacifica TaxID=915059 RepID=A0A1S1YTA5_FLAPC|nr:MATE family efflux transporter [Flammeovirga pacifica]OHX64236.1 hypothetical protein NH26_21785 [Flammeovirga pacifica]